MTTSAFYFHAFCTAVVQNFVVAVAFGFSNEIDELNVGAFLEHYCPVGIVVFSRSVDVETTGEFGLGYDFIMMFKCLGKVHLDALRIYYYVVVESFLDSMALMLNLPFKTDTLKNVKVEVLSSLTELLFPIGFCNNLLLSFIVTLFSDSTSKTVVLCLESFQLQNNKEIGSNSNF